METKEGDISEIKIDDLKKPFPAEDIIWRVQSTGESGGRRWAMVLAYVDARAVQDRLDEICGPGNWQTRYEQWSGGVLCKLSIFINNTWVVKCDGSPETVVESFKGGISKALVRTASAWGIGRYLYNLPTKFTECASVKPEDMTGWKQEYDKQSKKKWWWMIPELPEWALPSGSGKVPESGMYSGNSGRGSVDKKKCIDKMNKVFNEVKDSELLHPELKEWCETVNMFTPTDFILDATKKLEDTKALIGKGQKAGSNPATKSKAAKSDPASSSVPAKDVSDHAAEDAERDKLKKKVEDLYKRMKDEGGWKPETVHVNGMADIDNKSDVALKSMLKKLQVIADGLFPPEKK